MTRHKKDPLRPLAADEIEWLKQISRSKKEPAVHVIRAKAILAVASGANYQDAAALAGQKSADSVSRVVARFNEEGLLALHPRPGGGPTVKYSVAERERVLREARRHRSNPRWDQYLVIDHITKSVAESRRWIARN
jgi:transposase